MIFQKFERWFQTEIETSTNRIPSACAFCTIGLDGYPNSRIVSLKEIRDEAFVITGSLRSRKGLEVARNPKVALNFWWEFSERQVRIQGIAQSITDQEADQYFENRNRPSKLVSSIFNQGEEIESIEKMKTLFAAQDLKKDQPIKRPPNWGGYSVSPIRIEFMQFKESRLHERELYVMNDGKWQLRILQP